MGAGGCCSSESERLQLHPHLSMHEAKGICTTDTMMRIVLRWCHIQDMDQSDGQGWIACQWRGIEAEMRSDIGRRMALDGKWRLRLRSPLASLRELWNRRLNVRDSPTGVRQILAFIPHDVI